MSMLSLVVFLSACDITIDDIDQFILDNPQIIDRVDELTESARQRLEILENSGLVEEDNIEAVEESGVDEESSEVIEESETPLIEVNTDSGVTESSGLDEINNDDAVEELESSGVVEVESSGVIEESSSSGGGGSSSTPVTNTEVPKESEESSEPNPEIPMTSNLSLPAYTVLLRPDSVDSGLIEEPIFVYSFEISPGIYKIAAGNVITPETVLEDNGRKWGLVMVGHGHPKNGIWVQTSYSGAYRGQYAGIGQYYSLEQDLFVSSLNQLDPNYSPPTYSSETSSGITSSGITSSGVVNPDLPVITLTCNDQCWNGKDMALQVGQPFVDPGVGAVDRFGESLEVTVSGSVNTLQPGRVYYIRYNAVDASGLNAIEIIRHVNVQGHVISNPLNASFAGNGSIVLRQGEMYHESGVLVAGTNGNSSGFTTTIEGTVDTSILGLHHLYYTITNSENVTSELVKTITIIPWKYPDFVSVALNKTSFQTGETIVATLTLSGPQMAMDAMLAVSTSFISQSNHMIQLTPSSMEIVNNQIDLVFVIPPGLQGTYVSTNASTGFNFSLTSACGFQAQPSPDNPNPACEEGNIAGANVGMPKATITIQAVDVASQTIAVTSGFTFNKETGTITNYNPEFGLDVVIPRIIDGVEVTRIDYRVKPEFSTPENPTRGAFESLGLTSVVLPNTLQYIGPNSFRGNNLIGHLDIPDSVHTISDYAFYNNKIETVRLPEGTASPIKPVAFAFNSIHTLVIPNSITTIPREAFHSNPISSLELGSGVTLIEFGSFAFSRLSTITIPAQVEEIQTSFNYGYVPITTIIIEGDANRFNDIWEAIFPADLKPTD